MPSASRAQRAEAKYNVVLEYPNYGLHAAAASGNLGLVKYALEHGQPVNSVLDGLLPLHAACHGGADLVVQLLIENGADVNTPRLPRRYATDKHRTATPSLSIPGSSGSTPLHFAAASGHVVVVLTLLLCGANPDRPDKHGITPEMIARSNGHTNCADVLRDWRHNRDRDLREREAVGVHSAEDPFTKEEKSHLYCGSLGCKECATRKRIRMKRSIDNAIHMLRHSPSQHSGTMSPPHPSTSIHSSLQPPPSPIEGKPLGEYTFYPTNDTSIDDTSARRPSLPQIFDAPRASTSSSRSRRPSNISTSSRPRSAGTDAEPPTRVRGKISLLNIFKKANDTTLAPDNNSPSSSVATSASASPAPPSTIGMTPLPGHSNEPPAPNVSDGIHRTHHHHRLLSEGATTLSHSHALELRNVVSRESLRGRVQPAKPAGEPLGKGSPPARPGILRAHGRSTSSGQSTPQSDNTRTTPNTQSSLRALRFDSTSSAHVLPVPSRTDSLKRSGGARARQDSRSPCRRVQGQGSISSLRPPPSPGSASFGLRLESEPETLTQPATLPDRNRQTGYIEEEAEDEDEYGHPVSPRVGIRELETRLSSIDVERCRTRRASVHSTISEVDSQDTMHHHGGFQCPFSINQPPPEEETPSADSQLLDRVSTESRVRGNSMSSMITDSSAGPPSSFVPTPSIQQSNLPGPILFSPSSVPNESSPFENVGEREEVVVQVDGASPVKRSKTPGDIDIRSISTHAQAEALVALAQKRILEQSGDLNEQEIKTLGLSVGDGHTPLSARLAAYGESLAIERKFKQVEEQRRRSVLMNSVSASTLVADRGEATADEGTPHSARLDRQPSADEKRQQQDRSPPIYLSPEPINGFLTPPSVRNEPTSISNPESSGRLHRTHSSSGMISAPLPSSYNQLRSETMPIDRTSLPRSRTPDPQLYDVPPTLGAPLTRYQTCPTEDSYDFGNSTRTVKERQAARAQKLTKMGFSGSGGDHWRDTSVAHTRTHRQRFPGIKTLVQSLTGKA